MYLFFVFLIVKKYALYYLNVMIVRHRSKYYLLHFEVYNKTYCFPYNLGYGNCLIIVFSFTEKYLFLTLKNHYSVKKFFNFFKNKISCSCFFQITFSLMYLLYDTEFIGCVVVQTVTCF